jgi:hypothetical protein
MQLLGYDTSRPMARALPVLVLSLVRSLPRRLTRVDRLR